MLNKVLMIGNLTRDVELRYLPSGSGIANFTMALNRKWKDQSGESKEEVSFVRVTVWGKMAEVCSEHIGKGSQVLVEGRLKSSTWEDTDGKKRSSLDVVSERVQFMVKPKTQGKPQDREIDLDSERTPF